jgi:hypothetical protein
MEEPKTAEEHSSSNSNTPNPNQPEQSDVSDNEDENITHEQRFDKI